VTSARRALSVFFISAGTLHFVRPGIYERIMPACLPAHRELVLLSGAAEIAGGVAVAFPRTRRGAGLFLAAVLAAVFPANVQMAVRAAEFAPIPPALLWARLPLQPLLVLWTLRATRRES
jgi:uncharacterized membrane protein